MNFDDNFLRIGGANTEPIKALVSNLNSQDWENEAHQDTQTIPLVHDVELGHTNPVRRPALQTFDRDIRSTLAIAADFYDKSDKGRELTEKYGVGYFIRANLVRLLSGGETAENRDTNFSLTHSHRVHVPIITNNQVWFTVGQEKLHIPEGEIYEINNRRLYSMRNEGDEPCVHLILDYVLKGEKCCCGEKFHPDEPCTPEACADTDWGRLPCTCLPERT